MRSYSSRPMTNNLHSDPSVIINPYRFAAAGGGSPILDDISGSADFAFSVSRYLATAFIGSSVVKLREDATDTTIQFKLDGGSLVTNDANEYSVATWLSNNSASAAYVERWYDQSGNARDVQQTILADQPIFVASWSNGHPSIKGVLTVSNDARLITVSSFTASKTAGISAYIVAEFDGSNSGGLFGDPNSTTLGFKQEGLKAEYFADTGSAVSTTSDLSAVPHSISFESAAGSGSQTATIRVDGVQDASASLSSDARSGTWVMFHRRAGGSNTSGRWNGWMGEMIFSNSSFSTTDRDLIEASQKLQFNLP